MFNSLSRKLFGLLFATGILFFLVLSSSFHLSNKQKEMQQEVTTLLQIQGSIDHLRGQLWIFLQYSDRKSLEQVEFAQSHLQRLITHSEKVLPRLTSIKRMNQSLVSLLNQEKRNLSNDSRSYNEGLEIIHSRYNMIVQNMTEDILSLVMSKIKENEKEQNQVILSMAIKLILFSFVVGMISFIIYRRFQRGAKVLKYAFFNLSRGDFNQKIKTINELDKEFVSLINFCDRMRESLDQIAIRRDELQTEVDKKTQTLMQQKEELAYLASHDYLSGLLNRRVFETKVHNTIQQSESTDSEFALFFIDVDEFKTINDTYGHDAGDEVIKTISSRLKDHAVLSDIVGRIGGDEFVLFTDLSNGNYEKLSDRITRLTEVLQHELLYKDTIIAIKVSIGIALYPGDADCLDDLLKIADDNMYSKKKVIRKVGER